ncbi:hypothetical protein OKW41_007803 [Paraburkholderia sp. UCT70]
MRRLGRMNVLPRLPRQWVAAAGRIGQSPERAVPVGRPHWLQQRAGRFRSLPPRVPISTGRIPRHTGPGIRRAAFAGLHTG